MTEPPRALRIGVVLAGGQSRRMGRDKAQLALGQESLLARAIRHLMQAGCDEVWISGRIHPEHRSIPDPEPGQGPLAGITACHEAALAAAGGQACQLIFLPVDTPLLEGEHLTRLFDALAGAQASYYADSPLPMALAVDEASRQALAQPSERRSVFALLARLNHRELPVDADTARALRNLNTAQEWETLIHELAT